MCTVTSLTRRARTCQNRTLVFSDHPLFIKLGPHLYELLLSGFVLHGWDCFFFQFHKHSGCCLQLVDAGPMLPFLRLKRWVSFFRSGGPPQSCQPSPPVAMDGFQSLTFLLNPCFYASLHIRHLAFPEVSSSLRLKQSKYLLFLLLSFDGPSWIQIWPSASPQHLSSFEVVSISVHRSLHVLSDALAHIWNSD